MRKVNNQNLIVKSIKTLIFFKRWCFIIFKNIDYSFRQSISSVISKKSLAVFLLFSFNLASIQGIKSTISYYSDIEKGGRNMMLVKTLDLELSDTFGITKEEFDDCCKASFEVDTLNTGEIDLVYTVKTETNGYLCEDLLVEAIYLGRDGEETFAGNLVGFETITSFLPGKWNFDVSINKKSQDFQGNCDFDFVFEAREQDAKLDVGFWDKERLANTIQSVNAGPDESLFSQLQINEVSIGAERDLGHDFVELYNPTSEDINLGDFADSYIQLVKRERKGAKDSVLKTWKNTNNQIVKAHGYYLWASSYDKDFPGSVKADAKSEKYLSRNNGIALRLGAKNKGQIIDSLAWGKAQNIFIEGDVIGNNPAYGHSLERGLSGFDRDNNAQDFVEKFSPTPNNRNGKGDLPIVINEFLTVGADFSPFVELYNNSNKKYNLDGWSLLLETSLASTTKIITGEILKKKKWLAIDFANDTILSSSTITLFDAEGLERDKIKFRDATSTDKSFARIPDGSANWIDPFPTPGGANVLEADASIDNEELIIDNEEEEEDDAPMINEVRSAEDEEEEGPAEENSKKEESVQSKEEDQEQSGDEEKEDEDNAEEKDVDDNVAEENDGNEEDGVVGDEQAEAEEAGEEDEVAENEDSGMLDGEELPLGEDEEDLAAEGEEGDTGEEEVEAEEENPENDELLPGDEGDQEPEKQQEEEEEQDSETDDEKESSQDDKIPSDEDDKSDEGKIKAEEKQEDSVKKDDSPQVEEEKTEKPKEAIPAEKETKEPDVKKEELAKEAQETENDTDI